MFHVEWVLHSNRSLVNQQVPWEEKQLEGYAPNWSLPFMLSFTWILDLGQLFDNFKQMLLIGYIK